MSNQDWLDLILRQVDRYSEKSINRAKAAIRAKLAEERIDGCPCLLVEPCSYACSCANLNMSGGCMRCCKYGSLEQRKLAANRLAELEAALRGIND